MTDHAFGLPYNDWAAVAWEPVNDGLLHLACRDGREPVRHYWLSTSASFDNQPLNPSLAYMAGLPQPAAGIRLRWIDTYISVKAAPDGNKIRGLPGPRVYVYALGPEPEVEIETRKEVNSVDEDHRQGDS